MISVNVKSIIFLFVVISLVCNGTLATLVTAKQIDNITAALDDDIIVMCTGKGFAYYSEQAFIDTGKLIEITVPDVATQYLDGDSTNSEHASCALGLQADYSAFSLFTALPMLFYSAFEQQKALRLYVRLALNKRFTLQLQRAPPSALI